MHFAVPVKSTFLPQQPLPAKMDGGQGQQQPVVMIKDIRPGMKNLTMTVIVLDIGPPVLVKDREVRTLKVADASACVNLSLWGESGHYLSPGDIIRLTKAHVNVYRSCITLLNGKSGEVSKIGEFCMIFNEQLNMSEPNPELAAVSSGKNGSGMGPGGGGGSIPPGGAPGKVVPPRQPSGQQTLPPTADDQRAPQLKGPQIQQQQQHRINSGGNGKALVPPRGPTAPPVRPNQPRPERR